MTPRKLAAGLAVGLMFGSSLCARALPNPVRRPAGSTVAGQVAQGDPLTVSTRGADGNSAQTAAAFGCMAMPWDNVPQQNARYFHGRRPQHVAVRARRLAWTSARMQKNKQNPLQPFCRGSDIEYKFE